MVPQYIKDLFQFRAVTLPSTSLGSVSNQTFGIPKPKTSLYKESLSYSGPVIWNAIPSELKISSSLNVLLRKLLTGLHVLPFTYKYYTSFPVIQCRYHFHTFYHMFNPLYNKEFTYLLTNEINIYFFHITR